MCAEPSLRRRTGLAKTLVFYLFIRPRMPLFEGHNPLAGATYSLVFALYLVMIFTGLSLYAVDAHVDSPVRFMRGALPLLGGAQGARWIHHVGMWLLLGFGVHHLYSAVLVALTERNGTIGSMITGYKWIKPEERER